MTRRYMVVYEAGPEYMSGFVPDVPGCVSTGRTLDEMRLNLREALAFHLEGMQMDGLELPTAVTRLVELPENGIAEWLDVEMPVLTPLSA